MFSIGNLLLLSSLLITSVHSWSSSSRHHQGSPNVKCERLNVSFCRGLRYNLTAMPNIMGHEDQLQAERGLANLMPLVHYNCSRHLRFFLCSVFAPVCSEHGGIQVPACKPLCLSVRRDCERTLRELTLPWPHMLDCDKFPDNSNIVCVQPPPEENLIAESPPFTDKQQRDEDGDDEDDDDDDVDDDDNDDADDNVEGDEDKGKEDKDAKQWPAMQPMQPMPLPPRDRLGQKCPAPFVEAPYINAVSFARNSVHAFMLVTSCVPRCGEDIYYRNEDKKFTDRWMTGWAWLCFLSTLFTLLTFWVEPTRFRYPERPIVFLALCYNLTALAYILRGAVGPQQFGCATQDDGPSYVPVNDGMRSISCTLWWMVRYYFGLASSLWWAILCGCWLLSARNEWSSEALHNIASYLHAVAWGAPVLLTSGALISRSLSADELTGLCQISDSSVLWLEVLPNASLLILGCIFGCIAGSALIRVRRAIRQAGRSATKLERLMSRLGVFAVLYALPALASLACLLHESRIRPRWRNIVFLAALDCRLSIDCVPGSLPNYKASGLEVTLLRLLLSLVIGVTSGMWVWSGKTCRAWSKLLAAPTKPTRQPQAGQPFQGYKHEAANVA